MGCGGSKFDPDGEAEPVGLRPLLRRRIDEIRRRKHASVLKDDNTLSKKELLKDGGEEDENSNPHSVHEHSRKSVSSLEESFVSPATLQETKTHESNGAFKESLPEERSTKEDIKSEETANKVVNVTITKKVGEEEERHTAEEEEEDEEDEGMLSTEDEDGYICPGSPSFRVYYLDSISNNLADNKDDDKHDDSKKNKSQSCESESSTNSNEGSGTNKAKKVRKGRRFRRVIPKGGPVAVKNLLNVRSCYNPANSSSDNTRLLEKTAA